MSEGIEQRAAAFLDGLPSCPSDKEPTHPSKGEALQAARALLFPTRTRAPRYPLEALGSLAEAARDIAWGAQCDPALAGQSVLGAAALLAQAVANVRSLDGIKPVSLFLLTLAGSGEGKDASDRIALRRIEEWQRRAARAYERDRKAAAAEGRDPPPEPFMKASDITIEGLRKGFQQGRASQGIFSTEAGMLLAGHAMSEESRLKTAATLCALLDRGHLSVARVNAGRYEGYGKRLSAHLMVQPTAATEAVNDERLAAIGLWPRFLLAWPDAIPPRVFRPFEASDCPSIARFWARCDELLNRPAPEDCDELPAIGMSAGAQKRLVEFFETAERRARHGDWKAAQPFGLRAAELAARVAGVLAVFGSRNEISFEDIEGAVCLVEHSIENWLLVIERGRSDIVAEHSLMLYGWLLDHAEGVNVGDILRLGPAALRSRSRRDEAIERLEACDLVIRYGAALIAKQAIPANPAISANSPAESDLQRCEGFANSAKPADPPPQTFATFANPSQAGKPHLESVFAEIAGFADPPSAKPDPQPEGQAEIVELRL